MAAASHKLDPYGANEEMLAVPSSGLGNNYNSVSQPVKAQHQSILRSFSGTLAGNYTTSGQARKASKTNQQAHDQAEIQRLTQESQGLRLKIDELQEEKMQLKGNLKIHKDTI